MSADVDVTIEADRADLPALVRDLAAASFADVERFVEATSVLPFFHHPTALPLDLVIAGSGLEALFLDRAERRDLGGVVVPVISAGDLVVAKVLAGRPKDLEDAAGVLGERRGEIDLEHTRALIAQIEAALGQSDLTPALERLVASSRPPDRGRARRSPRPRR